MKERNYAIDAIRLISILAVVVIHVTTSSTDRTAPFSPDFFAFHFINQIFRFAVPLFFLISGFLLAGKYNVINSPIEFYKKRLGKILLPYVVWSAIYYIYIFPKPISRLFTDKFAMNLLTGNASYQLYFIPAIIILYFLFPLIIKYKKYLLTNWFIVILVIVSIIPTFYFYIDQKIPLFTPIRIAFYNLLPFVAGMFAAENIKNLASILRKKINVIFLGVIIFGLSIFMESVFMFTRTLNGDYLRNQWRSSVQIYGIFMGALIYYLYPIYLKRFEKNINFFAQYAIGVFFVHVAFLTFLLKFIDNFNFNNSVELIFTLTSVLILSFAFSIIVSKIKILNKLLGLRG